MDLGHQPIGSFPLSSTTAGSTPAPASVVQDEAALLIFQLEAEGGGITAIPDTHQQIDNPRPQEDSWSENEDFDVEDDWWWVEQQFQLTGVVVVSQPPSEDSLDVFFVDDSAPLSVPSSNAQFDSPRELYELEWQDEEGLDDWWIGIDQSLQAVAAPVADQPSEEGWLFEAEPSEIDDLLVLADEQVVHAPTPPQPQDLTDLEDAPDDDWWLSQEHVLEVVVVVEDQPGTIDLSEDDLLDDWWIGMEDAPQSVMQPSEDAWWFDEEVDAQDISVENEQVVHAPTPPQPEEPDPSERTREDDLGDESIFFDLGNEHVVHFVLVIGPLQPQEYDPSWGAADEDYSEDHLWFNEGNEHVTQAPQPNQPSQDEVLPDEVVADDLPGLEQTPLEVVVVVVEHHFGDEAEHLVEDVEDALVGEEEVLTDAPQYFGDEAEHFVEEEVEDQILGLEWELQEAGQPQEDDGLWWHYEEELEVWLFDVYQPVGDDLREDRPYFGTESEEYDFFCFLEDEWEEELKILTEFFGIDPNADRILYPEVDDRTLTVAAGPVIVVEADDRTLLVLGTGVL